MAELAATQLSKGQRLAFVFTGEWDEDGYMLSTPCYRAHLAAAIARELNPTSFAQFKALIYGALEVPPVASVALEAGYKRWHKTLGNRGL